MGRRHEGNEQRVPRAEGLAVGRGDGEVARLERRKAIPLGCRKLCSERNTHVVHEDGAAREDDELIRVSDLVSADELGRSRPA